MKEVHTINYYPINEGAARRAKEMNSFSDYKEGSATAEYRAMVDKAAAIAEQQKSRVDPMYHEKIDHLLDTYARKLAENMNQGFAIDARVPSMMIAGPANCPVFRRCAPFLVVGKAVRHLRPQAGRKQEPRLCH